MRKIEFRGKIINLPTEWGFVDYHFHDDKDGNPIRAYDGEWVYGGLLIENDKAYIIGSMPFRGEVHYFEVDPETVGQYIGLTDKNGKEIYEGDIFKTWNKNITFIGHDGFMFYVGKRQRRLERSDAIDMEIIGNIHENPELLGGEK